MWNHLRDWKINGKGDKKKHCKKKEFFSRSLFLVRFFLTLHWGNEKFSVANRCRTNLKALIRKYVRRKIWIWLFFCGANLEWLFVNFMEYVWEWVWICLRCWLFGCKILWNWEIYMQQSNNWARWWPENCEKFFRCLDFRLATMARFQRMNFQLWVILRCSNQATTQIVLSYIVGDMKLVFVILFESKFT